MLTTVEAKSSDYMNKIVKLWNLKTNHEVEFNATKTKNGYNLLISSKNKVFKELFSNKPIKINVDEGPLITSPNFTFGTAGLVAKGSVLDILNPKLTKDIEKNLKSKPEFNYEGKVSFSNELESKLVIQPFIIDDKDVNIKTSKIIDTSSYNLDTFTGKESIKIDEVVLKPKKEEGILKLSGVSINTNAPQEPIEDFMLFVKSSFEIKNLEFSAKGKNRQGIHTKLYVKFNGDTLRVDKDLLDFKLGYDIKAQDVQTIALAKGVKETTLNLEFKNLGISGFIDLIKLNKQMQKANEELLEASQKGDDVAMQKAILKTGEFANKIVPIWNKTFIANKSKLLLDLELKSDKTSYVKLDFLYKGKPLSGNAQSALISLMAQQLAIFDGKFDIALDSSLASSINPFALMGLDLLKAKGFVTVKDGIYYLKGELKGGKIILNGKAYTLPELTKALF